MNFSPASLAFSSFAISIFGGGGEECGIGVAEVVDSAGVAG